MTVTKNKLFRWLIAPAVLALALVGVSVGQTGFASGRAEAQASIVGCSSSLPSFAPKGLTSCAAFAWSKNAAGQSVWTTGPNCTVSSNSANTHTVNWHEEQDFINGRAGGFVDWNDAVSPGVKVTELCNNGGSLPWQPRSSCAASYLQDTITYSTLTNIVNIRCVIASGY
jgi:hypothetical protein